MKIWSKLRILKNIILGYIDKLYIDLNIITPKQLEKFQQFPNIVVSLTSFGRRVEKVVYYTLISLLNQSEQPNRIVLWLDSDNWNEQNIPLKLKNLTKLGVEIKFCKDLKSFKKLLPALETYPNSIIITVDDDVIYNKHLISNLLTTHRQFPNRIISCINRYPIIKNGGFIPYKFWPITSINDSNQYIMPIGVGGILYPPGCLHDDVKNYYLANKLCPKADDIWFWIMAKRNGTMHKECNTNSNHSFDDLFQFFHNGSALTHTNRLKDLNDLQLKQAIKYFNLNPNDLKNH